MQTRYDDEADHGSNTDMQSYWEFKIDSMLTVHAGDSGFTVDLLSGAGIFLPKDVGIYSRDRSGDAYRIFGTEDYGIRISLVSSNYMYPFDVLEQGIKGMYERDSVIISTYDRVPDSKYLGELDVELYDQDSSQLIIDKWVLDGSFLYELRAEIPVMGRTDGYRKLTNSMFNSFSLYDNTHYWKSKLDSTEGFLVGEVSYERATREEYEEGYCAVYNSEEGVGYGVIGELIQLEEGYLIPYDPTYTTDSLIYEVKLITGEDLTVSTPIDSYEDFLFIPEKTDQETLEFSIGYTLKEDTSQVCFQFYVNGYGFYLD